MPCLSRNLDDCIEDVDSYHQHRRAAFPSRRFRQERCNYRETSPTCSPKILDRPLLCGRLDAGENREYNSSYNWCCAPRAVINSMKLPNAESAVVDVAKLRDYCLSRTHPQGRHKARVFASVLGLTAQDAETLQKALLTAASMGEAIPTGLDEYGQRYALDFTVKGPTGAAGVRSLWIVRRGENFPRLTSCYVL